MTHAHWIVGITGASGAAYGIELCKCLLAEGYSLHLVITDAGWRVLREELDWDTTRRQETLISKLGVEYSTRIHLYPNRDIGASIASGSYRVQGMVVAPCSMGTLAAIANGMSDNLLERAADVMLKEGRPLLLLPRETPFHSIHLENMLKLSRMGVRIIPAMPAFYHKPQTIDDMIRFVVGKTLDMMGVDHQLFRRWGHVDDQPTTREQNEA